MIELSDIDFQYGHGGFRLMIDRLAIKRGSRAACIGPSGTGKTTLVNLIAGIAVPDAGCVTVDGQNVSCMSERERRGLRISRIGMVFQEFELLEYLTGLENILLPYYVSGSALTLTPEVRDRGRELARSVGIDHVMSRRPRRLSQGERQRVAICRAMVVEPEVILCDEPTGNLDPDTAARTLDLLFEQVAARHATLLMVTHNHAILDRFDEIVDITSIARHLTREGDA